MSPTMFFPLCLNLNAQSRHSKAWCGWRLLIAAVTALCFFLLVSTASTHHHASSLEDHTCSLCSAVADTLSDVPAASLAITILLQLPYQVFLTDKQQIIPATARLLPPSCGPPLPFINHQGVRRT